LLSLSNISKSFGLLRALDDVSFDVASGEVHALLGENGAGKSTLIKVAAGLLAPDAGTVRMPGSIPRDGSPGVRAQHAAPGAGRVGIVAQHFSSIPAFTVAENIALAAGWHDTGRAAERRAAEVIGRLGLPLDATAVVETLSVQLRQRLEIVKALAGDARVLLLDEPSAVLAPREVAELLQLVRDFAVKGGAVVLITHKLDEVFAAADRVTVLRRGKVTFTGPVAGETPATLSRAMIGGELPRVERTVHPAGDVLVRAEAVVVDRMPLSFTIRAGEIVGVAAIEGNGQRELLRAIAGLDEVTPTSGSLQVAAPVAFIPEDRTTEGIIPTLSLTENVLLGDHEAPWWLDWPALRERTTTLLEAFDVRGGDADAPAGALSGGNQQKLIFARVLERAPRVLVVEDPTRGLDVQATAEIHGRLRAATSAGAAVIVHSSDLDEVLALADRLFVLADGTLRELPVDTPRDVVGDAMLGLAPVS
jgi:simple sugar transport system ATP-binding protein